jgi:RNA polymerase sigma-70 factor, ECF subfamily
MSRPVQDRSDDELMRLGTEGDDRAFEDLVRRHQEATRAFCRRFMGSAAAGDDVAQEVFLQLWKQRHRYRPEARFRAYLFTIARTRCLMAVRGLRRVGAPLDSAVLVAGEDRDQLGRLLERERHRTVDRAVAALSPKLREAVLMRFTSHLGYADIARAAGRPESTIRARIFLALERLRATITGEQS